jgi:hypothetical protein
MHHDPDDLGGCPNANEVSGVERASRVVGGHIDPDTISGGARRSYQAVRALRLLTIIASRGQGREKEKEQD